MTEAAQLETAEPAEKSAVQEVVEIVKTVFYALLIALVLRVVLFQPFTIPSASMEPTLLEGDYIIVSKYSYGYSRHSIPFSPPVIEGRLFERTPERGDIIVFKLPRDGHTDYIKRLVGLPGDRIQVRDGALYVNDKAVTREPLGPGVTEFAGGYTRTVMRYQETQGAHTYTTHDFGPDGDLDNTGVFIVPEGHYFFMGDNRDNSQDSRVPREQMGVGMVPAENLVGKAQIILLSWKPEASIFKPWTWVLDAQPSRFFKLIK